ncbi:hypothetical protein QVD17_41288 [Tagetes erecta]|uniref:Uncharacterized protein n=1 Tax=Tagetes erecta TaxID=13708 RepID=A0AAD8JUN6_TARER|nr:hypothetical protein QVD17_41288 [Tagetes erecta]
MKQLETTSENNKLVPKRYSFAESNSTSASTPTSNSSTGDSNSDDPEAPAPSPTQAPTRRHKSKKKKVIRWILGFSAGVVAEIICGAIFSVLFKLVLNLIKGRKNDSGQTIFSQLIKAEELAFLEKDDGVASLQIIGKGGRSGERAPHKHNKLVARTTPCQTSLANKISPAHGQCGICLGCYMLPVSGEPKIDFDQKDGWDDNWGDDWDDVEAPSTPSMPLTPSISSAGVSSRRVNKDAWKD